MNIMKNIYIIILTVILLSCSSTFKINIDSSNEIVIKDYRRSTTDTTINFSPPKSITLKPESKEFKEIQYWFKANTENWSPTPASYLSSINFQLDQFQFNLNENGIIVNYVDIEGNGKQLLHSITDTSFILVFKKLNSL
jgi:uncharacterized protein YxeA